MDTPTSDYLKSEMIDVFGKKAASVLPFDPDLRMVAGCCRNRY